MKIDYVIMGSNLNPMYIDFWPIVSKVWKKIFNITPVLGLICDEDSEIYEDSYGLVKKFKSIENIDSGLQSQIVRLFLPKFLDGNCLISDIDMVPLSKNYFIDNVKNFNENNFYVFSSDNPECLKNKEYPMCYNLGHSNLYKKIFSINNEWVDFAKNLENMKLGWSTDQIFLYKKINEYEEKDRIILLKRGWKYGPADNRIDRINWFYDPNKVKKGEYIDSHLLRPYKNNAQKIDYLINFLFEQN